MPKRRKREAPALIPQLALRAALRSLRCKLRSDKALKSLQKRIGDFAKQLVHDAAEERKHAFETACKARREQRLLPKSPYKKLSVGDVRAALHKPCRAFCAGDVGRLTEPLDADMLPLPNMQPSCARRAGNMLTISSYFVG